MYPDPEALNPDPEALYPDPEALYPDPEALYPDPEADLSVLAASARSFSMEPLLVMTGQPPVTRSHQNVNQVRQRRHHQR